MCTVVIVAMPTLELLKLATDQRWLLIIKLPVCFANSCHSGQPDFLHSLYFDTLFAVFSIALSPALTLLPCSLYKQLLTCVF